MAAKTTRIPPSTPPSSEPLFIDFAAREGGAPRRMRTCIPSPEQLAVWQSVGETFTRLGAEWAHQNAAMADLPHDHPDVIAARTTQGKQAVRGIARSMKLIKSVLMDEVDHEWVEDQIMEGATLERMLGIVTEAVNVLRDRTASAGKGSTATRTKSKAALAE